MKDTNYGFDIQSIKKVYETSDLTNQQVAEILGITRATYETKKKNGKFNRPQIVKLLDLFNQNFEYLFEIDQPRPAR